MLDVYPEGWTNEFKEMYKDVCDCPVKWAKYIEGKFKSRLYMFKSLKVLIQMDLIEVQKNVLKLTKM